MTKLLNPKRLLALAAAVVMLVTALYVPLAISAQADDSGQTTVDYTTLENKSKLSIDYYYSSLGMFDGAGLNVENGALVTDSDWFWQLNAVDTLVTEKTGGYAVYKIAEGTPFTVGFNSATDLSQITVLVSKDAVSWKAAIPTADETAKTLTLDNADSEYAYVKVVLPAVDADESGITSVKYTKAEDESNYKRVDYGVNKPTSHTGLGSGSNDTNVLIKRGVWESGGNLKWLKTGIIQPDWQTVDNAKTENSYNGYVTYKVQPGTRFGLTVTSSRSTSDIAKKLGYENPLDWTVEIYGSADNVSFTRIDAAYTNSARYSNSQNGTGDAMRSTDYSFIVPEGMIYIKCKLPITQNLSTLKGTDGTAVYPYAGNDLFQINKVEFSQIKYDYRKAAEGDYYINSEVTSSTAPALGIFTINGISKKLSSGIDLDYNFLYNGKSGAYVSYEVEKGTPFYAGIRIHWSGGLKSFVKVKDYHVKLQGLDKSTNKWIDIDTLTFDSSYDGSVDYTLNMTAEQSEYDQVRIYWPDTKANNNVVGNNLACVSEVAFTAPKPDTRAYYNYTDLEALPMDNSQYIGSSLDPAASPAKLGIYRISENPVNPAICGLNRNNPTGELRANYNAIANSEQGTVSFYADYEVMPDTKFTAIVTVNNSAGWGKPYWEAMECYQGRKFEFTILTSPDGENWTEQKRTGDAYGQLYIDVKVPADHSYVRVLFPQDGNPNGVGNHGEYTMEDGNKGHYRIFNDMASLDGVKYEPSENSYYGRYFDFNAIGENSLEYDDVNYKSLLLYDYAGVAISKYENGKAYLGASDAYANTATADTKPFVTYCVEGGSDTKIVTTKNPEKAVAMGVDWNVKIYESADNTTWKQVTVQPENASGTGLGSTDTYRFITSADTKYLKIELPHSGTVNGENGSKLIGIANVGLSPADGGEKDYYGNYTFDKVLKYYDEEDYNTKENINAVNMLLYDMYKMNPYSIHHSVGTGLTVMWDYLNGCTDKTYPYVVYNVVSGTAFQTEITFNDTSVSTIQNFVEEEYLPRLYISSDCKEWTEYYTSRVKLKNGTLAEGRGSLILTIDSIPEDINFVKIEFGQNGDASIITNKAFPYAGNDVVEIATVSFTKGELVWSEEDEKEDEDGEDESPQYVFLNPNQDIIQSTYIPGDSDYDDGYDYSDDYDYDYSYDFSYDDDLDFDEDTEEQEIVETNGKKKVKKVVKKMITVIDGYYYPLWVWILWIGGGVVALAAVATLVIILVKRKKKKAVN